MTANYFDGRKVDSWSLMGLDWVRSEISRRTSAFVYPSVYIDSIGSHNSDWNRSPCWSVVSVSDWDCRSMIVLEREWIATIDSSSRPVLAVHWWSEEEKRSEWKVYHWRADKSSEVECKCAVYWSHWQPCHRSRCAISRDVQQAWEKT